MAGVRMTGLISGLDTETLVTQLASAYQTKIDNVTKEKTKAEWKKEAWAALNTKLMNFYKGALSTFKSTSTYNTKKIAGTLSGVTITAGSNAANGSHKVQVTSTASAQMWTGYKINENKYTASSYKAAAIDENTTISDLYTKEGYALSGSLDDLNGSSLTVSYGDQTKEILINGSVDGAPITADTKISDVLDSINSQLAGTGLTASFEKGAFKFTNTTATEQELVNDTGETVTSYTGGYEISVKANDAISAKVLGISENETSIKQLSDTNKTNSVSASTIAYNEVLTEGSSVTGSTKLTDLGIADGTVIKVQGTEITVTKTTTLNNLATAMGNAGINASYDATQGRFYLSSKATGTANKFEIETDDDTLSKLGLKFEDGYTGKIDASDAAIVYNGVEYVSSSNSFSINGLTIDVNAVGEAQDFTVDTDVDGIYEKIKNFVTEYNALISEMNTLYNADSARDYEPLTSDEKEAMSDEDVEKWEAKIKSSLLRRDSTISSLLSSMRTTLNKSVEVTNADGTTTRYALSSFGIVTGTYTENGQLHICGDAEDADYADYADKLKAAIAANPDAVMKTLSSLGNEIYTNLQNAMKRKDGLSSALTFYNDVQIDSEISDYKDEISELQEKLNADQDKYYAQFSAMETALAKLQSQQTYISQLFAS